MPFVSSEVTAGVRRPDCASVHPLGGSSFLLLEKGPALAGGEEPTGTSALDFLPDEFSGQNSRSLEAGTERGRMALGGP